MFIDYLEREEQTVQLNSAIEVGRTYGTVDGRVAKVLHTVVGDDSCNYYVGLIDEWPKPVLWDENGRDLSGCVHLSLGPKAKGRASLIDIWVVANKQTGEVDHQVFLTLDRAYRYISTYGLQETHEAVRVKEVQR